MARGEFTANSRITTNTDTTVIAAPGANQQIHVKWITIDVEVEGTASLVRIEDGAGGNVLAAFETTDGTASLDRWYDGIGLVLSSNTLLNAETTGTGAATIVINVGYEVQ